MKISSGLQVMQREDLISAQTITRNKAHIPRPSVGVSQIPRDNVAEEGGDIKEEIEHFTSVPEDTTQPSSQAHARALDRLDHLIERVEQMYGMLDSHMQHSSLKGLEGHLLFMYSNFILVDRFRLGELR